MGVEITSLEQNANQVGRLEKFEATFTLSQTYANPYDPNIIDIHVIITQPDNATITIPGFYDDVVTIGHQQ